MHLIPRLQINVYIVGKYLSLPGILGYGADSLFAGVHSSRLWNTSCFSSSYIFPCVFLQLILLYCIYLFISFQEVHNLILTKVLKSLYFDRIHYFSFGDWKFPIGPSSPHSSVKLAQKCELKTHFHKCSSAFFPFSRSSKLQDDIFKLSQAFISQKQLGVKTFLQFFGGYFNKILKMWATIMQQVTKEHRRHWAAPSLSPHEYGCGEGKGRGDYENSSDMGRLIKPLSS